jgi:hypothetical protein
VIPSGAFRKGLKREAGGNPARSRHCDRGADPIHATGALALGRCGNALIRESGDLPRLDPLSLAQGDPALRRSLRSKTGGFSVSDGPSLSEPSGRAFDLEEEGHVLQTNTHRNALVT